MDSKKTSGGTATKQGSEVIAKQVLDVFTIIDNVVDSKTSSHLEKVDCATNDGKFAESYRYQKVSSIGALQDITDNPFDAEASVVNVSLEWFKQNKTVKSALPKTDGRGSKKITIADNGCGMDKKELIEAFRLGSVTKKDRSKDFGAFGIGMNKSGMSICRKITVLTRKEGGKVLIAIYSIDSIIEDNNFQIVTGEADFVQKRTFESELEALNDMCTKVDVPSTSSGTVVILEDLDRFSWKYEKTFLERICGTGQLNTQTKHPDPSFGEIYHIPLKNERIFFYVNGEEIAPHDPVRDLPTENIVEEVISLPEGDITLTIAELTRGDTKYSNDKGIGFFSRGFYVVRNGRQIMKAATLGLLSNRNNLNNVRIELAFCGGKLDELLRVSNQKDSISIDENIRAKIGTVIAPHLKTIDQKFSRDVAETGEENIDTSKAEVTVKKKLDMLKPVKGFIKEKRKSPETQGEKRKKSQGGTKGRNPNRTQPNGQDKGVEFAFINYGPKGSLFEPEYLSSGKIKVNINKEHPFFGLLCSVTADKDSEVVNLQNPILLLMYSMSRCELDLWNDTGGKDNKAWEAVSGMRSDVGRDMGVLLSH